MFCVMITSSQVGSHVVGSGSGSPMTHGARLSSHETPLATIDPPQQLDPP